MHGIMNIKFLETVFGKSLIYCGMRLLDVPIRIHPIIIFVGH